MGDQSILDILPQDVLELVLLASREANRKGYCGLRLLSKAINNLVEPKVFTTVTIAFTRDSSAYIEEKLRDIALGNTPFTKYAKELVIGTLISVREHPEHGYRYNTFQGAERERLLACQTEWLIPAIKALSNVERISYRFEDRTPHDEVLDAISGLPSLKDIRSTWINMASPSFAKLSGLERIILTHPRVEDLGLWGNLGKIIAKSPDLFSLDITVGVQNEGADLWQTSSRRTEDLERVLVEAMQSPTFKPKLTRLSISQDGLRLTASCVPFLRRLTFLKIGSHVEPKFWKALSSAGVALQTLHLTSLDGPSSEYMLSFAGLKEISVGWPHVYHSDVPGDGDATVHQFFHTILPHHRGSLQALDLINGGLGPWCASKANMEGITQCTALQKLSIVYFFPPQNKEIAVSATPLAWIFLSIARSLPKLQELCIAPVRKFQTQFGCGRAHFNYRKAIKGAFVHAVESAEFEAQSRPLFSVSSVGSDFKVVNAAESGNVYRYEAKDTETNTGSRSLVIVYDPDA